MRILSIDHGTVRVGLAISDDMELIASPLKTLQVSAQIFWEISDIVQRRSVGKIVIGMPYRLNGQRGSAADRVELFAQMLAKTLTQDVPIEFVDERLSSKTAEEALKSGGHEIDPKSGVVDQLAAVVILQDYLNQQRGPEGYLLPSDAFEMPWLNEQPKPRAHRRK
jgi:putative holliday junction resolvase